MYFSISDSFSFGQNDFSFNINNNFLTVTSNLLESLTLDTNSNIQINGFFNGVNVESHSSRHQPGGQDPLLTSTSINVGNIVNSEGSSTFFARSDHQHAHSSLIGNNLHVVATNNSDGFLSAPDKTLFDTSTDLAVSNTLAKRNASDASVAVGNNLQLANLSLNLQTNLNVSPNIVSNYNIVLPIDSGSSNQFLLTQSNGDTFWSNSIYPTLTLRGDMLVRDSSNLINLSIPQPIVNDGANISYLLETNTNLFPTWTIPPFNPFYGYSEITDFTGSSGSFAETNWRTNATTNTVIDDSGPKANIGNPIGSVSISVNFNAARAMISKGTTNTQTLTFTSNGTVYFESAVNTDVFNSGVGSTVICEVGISNCRTVGIVATDLVGFRFPGSIGSGTTSPLQFITTRAGVSTTFNMGSIPGNTWVKLSYVVYGRTELRAYINDVLTYTLNPLTNFPDDTTWVSPYVLIRRVGSVGGNLAVTVDYIKWGKFYLNGRY
jgi:hypothetical protein